MLTTVADAIDYKRLAVEPKTIKRLEPYLRSWRSLHPYIMEMTDSKSNLATLSSLLNLELKRSRPRRIMIARLHMKLNAMRREIEFNNVMGYAKD